MDDKFYLETLLTASKNLSDILFYATTESSNPVVHQTFQNCLNHALEWQNEIYNYMEEKGYYQVENVNSTKLAESFAKIQPLTVNTDCGCYSCK